MAEIWEENPILVSITVILVIGVFGIFGLLWGMIIIPMVINLVIVVQSLLFMANNIFATRYPKSILNNWIFATWWIVTGLILVGFMIAVQSELFWWWPSASIGLIVLEIGIMLLSKLSEHRS